MGLGVGPDSLHNLLEFPHDLLVGRDLDNPVIAPVCNQDIAVKCRSGLRPDWLRVTTEDQDKDAPVQDQRRGSQPRQYALPIANE